MSAEKHLTKCISGAMMFVITNQTVEAEVKAVHEFTESPGSWEGAINDLSNGPLRVRRKAFWLSIAQRADLR